MLVLLFFILGIVIGFFIRERKFPKSYIDKSIYVLIILLLFFLGISVGKNPDLITSFSRLGLMGLFYGIATTTGTVALLVVFYNIFRKRYAR